MIKLELTNEQAEALFGQIAKDINYMDPTDKNVEILKRLQKQGIGSDWKIQEFTEVKLEVTFNIYNDECLIEDVPGIIEEAVDKHGYSLADCEIKSTAIKAYLED